MWPQRLFPLLERHALIDPLNLFPISNLQQVFSLRAHVLHGVRKHENVECQVNTFLDVVMLGASCWQEARPMAMV